MSLTYDPMWVGPTVAMGIGVVALIWAKLASRAYDRQLDRERNRQI